MKEKKSEIENEIRKVLSNSDLTALKNVMNTEEKNDSSQQQHSRAGSRFNINDQRKPQDGGLPSQQLREEEMKVEKQKEAFQENNNLIPTIQQDNSKELSKQIGESNEQQQPLQQLQEQQKSDPEQFLSKDSSHGPPTMELKNSEHLEIHLGKQSHKMTHSEGSRLAVVSNEKVEKEVELKEQGAPLKPLNEHLKEVARRSMSNLDHFPIATVTTFDKLSVPISSKVEWWEAMFYKRSAAPYSRHRTHSGGPKEKKPLLPGEGPQGMSMSELQDETQLLNQLENSLQQLDMVQETCVVLVEKFKLQNIKVAHSQLLSSSPLLALELEDTNTLSRSLKGEQEEKSAPFVTCHDMFRSLQKKYTEIALLIQDGSRLLQSAVDSMEYIQQSQSLARGRREGVDLLSTLHPSVTLNQLLLNAQKPFPSWYASALATYQNQMVENGKALSDWYEKAKEIDTLRKEELLPLLAELTQVSQSSSLDSLSISTQWSPWHQRIKSLQQNMLKYESLTEGGTLEGRFDFKAVWQAPEASVSLSDYHVFLLREEWKVCQSTWRELRSSLLSSVHLVCNELEVWMDFNHQLLTSRSLVYSEPDIRAASSSHPPLPHPLSSSSRSPRRDSEGMKELLPEANLSQETEEDLQQLYRLQRFQRNVEGGFQEYRFKIKQMQHYWDILRAIEETIPLRSTFVLQKWQQLESYLKQSKNTSKLLERLISMKSSKVQTINCNMRSKLVKAQLEAAKLAIIQLKRKPLEKGEEKAGAENEEENEEDFSTAEEAMEQLQQKINTYKDLIQSKKLEESQAIYTVDELESEYSQLEFMLREVKHHQETTKVKEEYADAIQLIHKECQIATKKLRQWQDVLLSQLFQPHSPTSLSMTSVESLQSYRNLIADMKQGLQSLHHSLEHQERMAEELDNEKNLYLSEQPVEELTASSHLIQEFSLQIKNVFDTLHKTKLLLVHFEMVFLMSAVDMVKLCQWTCSTFEELERLISELNTMTADPASKSESLSSQLSSMWLVLEGKCQEVQDLFDEKATSLLERYPYSYFQNWYELLLQEINTEVDKVRGKIAVCKEDQEEQKVLSSIKVLLEEFQGISGSSQKMLTEFEEKEVTSLTEEILNTQSMNSNEMDLSLEEELGTSFPTETAEWLYDREVKLTELQSQMRQHYEQRVREGERLCQQLEQEIGEAEIQLSLQSQQLLRVYWNSQQHEWLLHLQLMEATTNKIKLLLNIVQMGRRWCEAQLNLQDMLSTWISWCTQTPGHPSPTSNLLTLCRNEVDQVEKHFNDVLQHSKQLETLQLETNSLSIIPSWLQDSLELALNVSQRVIDKMRTDTLEVVPVRWSQRLQSHGELLLKCIEEEMGKINTLQTTLDHPSSVHEPLKSENQEKEKERHQELEQDEIKEWQELEKEYEMFNKKQEQFQRISPPLLDCWQKLCLRYSILPSQNVSQKTWQQVMEREQQRLSSVYTTYTCQYLQMKSLLPALLKRKLWWGLRDSFKDVLNLGASFLNLNEDQAIHLLTRAAEYANSISLLHHDLSLDLQAISSFMLLQSVDAQKRVQTFYHNLLTDLHAHQRQCSTASVFILKCFSSSSCQRVEKETKQLLQQLDSFETQLTSLAMSASISNQDLLDTFSELEKEYLLLKSKLFNLNEPSYLLHSLQNFPSSLAMVSQLGVTEAIDLCHLQEKSFHILSMGQKQINEKWHSINQLYSQKQKILEKVVAYQIAQESLQEYQQKGTLTILSFKDAISSRKIPSCGHADHDYETWKHSALTLFDSLEKDFSNIIDNLEHSALESLPIQTQMRQIKEWLSTEKWSVFLACHSQSMDYFDQVLESLEKELMKEKIMFEHRDLDTIEAKVDSFHERIQGWSREVDFLFESHSTYHLWAQAEMKRQLFKITHIKQFLLLRRHEVLEREASLNYLQQHQSMSQTISDIVEEEYVTQLACLSDNSQITKDSSIETYLNSRKDWKDVFNRLRQDQERLIGTVHSEEPSLSSLFEGIRNIQSSALLNSSKLLELGPSLYFRHKLLIHVKKVEHPCQLVLEQIWHHLISLNQPTSFPLTTVTSSSYCLLLSSSSTSLQQGKSVHITTLLELLKSALVELASVYQQLEAETHYKDALLLALGSDSASGESLLVEKSPIAYYFEVAQTSAEDLQKWYHHFSQRDVALHWDSAPTVEEVKESIYFLQEAGDRHLYQFTLFQSLQSNLLSCVSLTLPLLDLHLRQSEKRKAQLTLWHQLQLEKSSLSSLITECEHFEHQVRHSLVVDRQKTPFPQDVDVKQWNTTSEDLTSKVEKHLQGIHQLEKEWFSGLEQEQYLEWRNDFLKRFFSWHKNVVQLCEVVEPIQNAIHLNVDLDVLNSSLETLLNTMTRNDISLDLLSQVEHSQQQQVEPKWVWIHEKISAPSAWASEPSSSSNSLVVGPLWELLNKIAQVEDKQQGLVQKIREAKTTLFSKQQLQLYTSRTKNVNERLTLMKKALHSLDVASPTSLFFFQPASRAFEDIKKEWLDIQRLDCSLLMLQKVDSNLHPPSVHRAFLDMEKYFTTTWTSHVGCQQGLQALKQNWRDVDLFIRKIQFLWKQLNIEHYLTSNQEGGLTHKQQRRYRRQLQETVQMLREKLVNQAPSVLQLCRKYKKHPALKIKAQELYSYWCFCISKFHGVQSQLTQCQEALHCYRFMATIRQKWMRLGEEYLKIHSLRPSEQRRQIKKVDQEREHCYSQILSIPSTYSVTSTRQPLLLAYSQQLHQLYRYLVATSIQCYRQLDVRLEGEKLIIQIKETMLTGLQSGFNFVQEWQGKEALEYNCKSGKQLLQNLKSLNHRLQENLLMLVKIGKYIRHQHKELVESLLEIATRVKLDLASNLIPRKQATVNTLSSPVSSTSTPNEPHRVSLTLAAKECHESFEKVQNYIEKVVQSHQMMHRDAEQHLLHDELSFTSELRVMEQELHHLARSLPAESYSVLQSWPEKENDLLRRLKDIQQQFQKHRPAFSASTLHSLSHYSSRVLDGLLDMSLLISILRIEEEGGLQHALEQSNTLLQLLDQQLEKTMKVVDKYQPLMVTEENATEPQNVSREVLKKNIYLDVSLLKLSMGDIDSRKVSEYHRFISSPCTKLAKVSSQVLIKYSLLKRLVRQLESVAP